MAAVSQKLATLRRSGPMSRIRSEEERRAPAAADFTVQVENGVYVVESERLRSILATADMDDYESLQYFQRVLIGLGVIEELEKMGIQEGDTVRIDDFEFDFIH